MASLMFSLCKARCLTQKQAFNVLVHHRSYAKRRGVKEMKEAKLAKLGGGKTAEKKSTAKVIVKSDLKKSQPEILSKLNKNTREGDPVDNVYYFKDYKFRSYTIEEAIRMHTESHHASIYSNPNGIVNAFLELDMSLHNKKNKCLDKFTSRVHYPHDLQISQPYRVLVICQRSEEEEAAKAAGAYHVANADYIKKIKTGDVPNDDFDYCVTTPDLLSQFVPIRGILNKRFPNQRKGTVGFDVGTIVNKLAYSTEYRIVGNPPEPQYAWLTTPVGKLQMPASQIEENITALMYDLCNQKPPNLGPPIVRLFFLTCPPTDEKFLISHEKYVPIQEDESDDEDEAAVKS